MRRLFFCCKDYNRLSSFLVASWILSTRCNGNVGNLHCTSEKNEFLNKNVTVGERTPNNRIVFSTSAAEMLKASQEALVQQASRDLISIQRKELQHFEKILGEFGLQGALFAGFISQVLCNVDALNNDPGPWKYIFWISLTIVSSLSLGITFSTTLAGIYAPGLALRGPPGSMVRSLNGLVHETKTIFRIFFWVVIIFQFSNFSLCYVVMDPNCAIFCSIIFISGTYLWYYQCLRIYNRFKFDRFTVYDLAEAQNEDDNDLIHKNNEHLVVVGKEDTTPNKNTTIPTPMIDDNSHPKWKSSFHESVGSVSTLPSSANLPKTSSSVISAIQKKNYHEGYLTYKSSSSRIFTDKWNRVYVVLNQKELYFYTTKEDFQLKPKQTLKNRPIDLTGYIVETSSGPNHELQITLSPLKLNDERRKWEFRVDTMDELQSWSEAFQKIALLSDYNHEDLGV